jgi:hypothetical protein
MAPGDDEAADAAPVERTAAALQADQARARR